MNFGKNLFTIKGVVMCLLIANCDATALTRKTRTIPFEFSPSKWLEPIRSLLPGNQIWQMPLDTVSHLYRVLTGPRNAGVKMIFEFDPEDGPRASYEFQRRFGFRGQRLIDLLGAGYYPTDRSFQRPILPVPVLTPPLPSS